MGIRSYRYTTSVTDVCWAGGTDEPWAGAEVADPGCCISIWVLAHVSAPSGSSSLAGRRLVDQRAASATL